MLLELEDRSKVSATTLSDIMAEKVQTRSVVTLPSVIVKQIKKCTSRILLSEEQLRNFKPSRPVNQDDPDQEKRWLVKSIAEQHNRRESLVEQGLHHVSQGYRYNLVKFCPLEWWEITEECLVEQPQGVEAASTEAEQDEIINGTIQVHVGEQLQGVEAGSADEGKNTKEYVPGAEVNSKRGKLKVQELLQSRARITLEGVEAGPTVVEKQSIKEYLPGVEIISKKRKSKSPRGSPV